MKPLMLAVFFCTLLGLTACGGPDSLQACSVPTNASCTSDEAKMSLITGCNAYANALMTLTAIKPKLPATAVSSVDASVVVVQPLCHGPVANPANALTVVQAELAKLQAAQAAAGSK